MPTQVAISIDVAANLEGIAEAKSALDDFNSSATAGFQQTTAALDDLNAAFEQAIQNAREFSGAWAQMQGQGSSLLGAGGWMGSSGSGGGLPGGFADFAFPGAGIGMGTGGGWGAAARGGPHNLATALGLPFGMPIGTILSKLGARGEWSGTDSALFGLGLMGMMAGPGIANAIGGTPGRVVGGLVGAGGGALSGFEIGNMIVPGIGGVIGAVGGAIIGGLISLFGGGNNAAKNHDSQLENQGFGDMHQIVQDYYNFRTTYDSAISQVNQIWNSMVAQFQRKDSAQNQYPYYKQIIDAVNEVQNARVARQQLQGMMAVPEFQGGGPVPGAAGAAVPAVLHGGEFVMTQQAVTRIGASVLQGLNSGSSGPRPAGSGVSITIDPDSAAWLEQALAANPKALAKGIGVVLRSGGPTSRALRG